MPIGQAADIGLQTRNLSARPPTAYVDAHLVVDVETRGVSRPHHHQTLDLGVGEPRPHWTRQKVKRLNRFPMRTRGFGRRNTFTQVDLLLYRSQLTQCIEC